MSSNMLIRSLSDEEICEVGGGSGQIEEIVVRGRSGRDVTVEFLRWARIEGDVPSVPVIRIPGEGSSFFFVIAPGTQVTGVDENNNDRPDILDEFSIQFIPDPNQGGGGSGTYNHN